MPRQAQDRSPRSMSRRDLLQSAAVAGAAASLLARGAAADTSTAEEIPVAQNGRIRQSLVHWCYQPHWPDVEELCRVARRLGCPSIELIDAKHWPTLKKYGLTCAIASSHGFRTGFNNPGEWEECLRVLRERIDQCAASGVERVITFTGMANGISKDEGARNCVAGLKQIASYAEEKGVTVCLEMLNTRDDTHPMKGHPGYQGNDTEYCIDILKQVDSPRVKLLFDIYHVQIMNGDVIRRIRQHKDFIAHIHTAGNPGRGELDQTQEISYPGIMQALLDAGYDGYVGQEFIPTREAYAGLAQAVAVCDV